MTGPLVLIPCGNRKGPAVTVAWNLYVGTHFRKGLRAALALTTGDRIRIISAKHGLMPVDQVVAPYNLKMGEPGCVTAELIARQAAEQGLVGESGVIGLLPRKYATLCRETFPDMALPFADLPDGRIGFQGEVLKNIYQTRRLPCSPSQSGSSSPQATYSKDSPPSISAPGSMGTTSSSK